MVFVKILRLNNLRKVSSNLLICDLLGSSSGTNCEKSEKTDLVSQNCHRFKKILQFRRKSVTQPGTSVRTTQQTSASSSSEFECSDDEYENDLQIQNYQGFDFFDLTDSHEIDLNDDNVTVYMANWCVKRVIKKLMKLKNSKSCSSCRELLETLSDRQSNELDMTEQLTKNKARFGDFSTLSGQIPQILYGHLVKEQVKKVFIKINENFRSAMKFYMNPQGENISKNVMIWLMRDKAIDTWANEILECRLHRIEMINLFIRAKIFQLLKHKNQLTYVMPKSFSQTRRQLRDQ